MSESTVGRPARVGVAPAERTTPSADSSTGELIAQATQQISDLIHLELALARAELVDKGKNAGRGAGLLGGAGLIACYGSGALVAAVIAAIAIVWPVWAAALVIGAILLLIAGLLAMTGRKRLGRAVPPLPKQVAESVKSDVREIKGHLGERHHG